MEYDGSTEVPFCQAFRLTRESPCHATVTTDLVFYVASGHQLIGPRGCVEGSTAYQSVRAESLLCQAMQIINIWGVAVIG